MPAAKRTRRTRKVRTEMLTSHDVALAQGAMLLGLGFNTLAEGMLSAAFPRTEKREALMRLLLALHDQMQHLQPH